MKLDRNMNVGGRGKYALLKLRKIENYRGHGTFAGIKGDIGAALRVLDKYGLIEWGEPKTEGEFFVIKMRDAYAEPAMVMYANTAMLFGDKEYAQEVKALADRSGNKSKFCKRPD
jgi:hypothetical protein